MLWISELCQFELQIILVAFLHGSTRWCAHTLCSKVGSSHVFCLRFRPHSELPVSDRLHSGRWKHTQFFFREEGWKCRINLYTRRCNLSIKICTCSTFFRNSKMSCFMKAKQCYLKHKSPPYISSLMAQCTATSLRFKFWLQSASTCACSKI